MNRIASPLELAIAALVLFVALVGVVNFVDETARIGACGVGPAAPSHCTWDDVHHFENR